MADHPPIQPGSLVAGVPDDVLTLIVRYYDNDLDQAGLDQLRSALMQSASARDVFIRWGLHRELLNESLSPNYQTEGENVWANSPEALAELARFEASVQAPLVHLHHFKAARPIGLWLAGAGALAAVLALAITLVLVFQGNGNPSPSTTASTPDTPAIQEAIQPAPVATLTAERDAVWRRRPGQDLYANQRLTLTQGFAEITTNRGAVAIIEAPATIELTDNDNALRLHTGKLVGICETQSSKGFLVRTPHMDVTDLGTRFGVDATRAAATEVHVFEGQVEVSKPSTQVPGGMVRQRITANNALRSGRSDSGFVAIDQGTVSFARVLTRSALPGTGLGLIPGEVDPNWRIIAIDGQPLAKPIDLIAGLKDQHGGLPENDPLRGLWLTYDGQGVGTNNAAMVLNTVEVKLDIPEAIDLKRVELRGVCYVDNAFAGLRVNGVTKGDGLRPSLKNQPRTPWSLTLPGSALKHGLNTVQFDIENEFHSPLGVLVQWELVPVGSPESRQEAPQAAKEVAD